MLCFRARAGKRSGAALAYRRWGWAGRLRPDEEGCTRRAGGGALGGGEGEEEGNGYDAARGGRAGHAARGKLRYHNEIVYVGSFLNW